MYVTAGESVGVGRGPCDDPTGWSSGLTLSELDVELRAVAARVAAETCRFLELLAEFDARSGHERWECATAADWLSWRCGTGTVAAREQVRVARRLATMPRVTAAFRAGRISYSKVRAIARVCAPQIEQRMLDLADVSTARQLERMCSALRRSGELATEEAEQRSSEDRDDARSFLRVHRNERGELVGAFRLGGVAAETVENAIRLADQQLADPPEARERHTDPEGRVVFLGAEPKRSDARRARALVAMAGTVLAHAESTAPARPEVVVHVDLAALAAAAAEQAESTTPADQPGIPADARWPAVTAAGRRLSAPALGSLLSDAGLRAVARRADGTHVDLGRHSRTVNGPLLRALRARDGHCRFPGCRTRHRLHAHHIIWWALGGRTDRENLSNS